MLNDTDALATIPVTDLNRARKFYEGLLGLRPERIDPHFVHYRSGKSLLLVYVSAYAGTNKATAVTWTVGDQLDAIVAALKAKGAVFEHYDLPQTRRHGDIHVAGTTRVAWLKDPDENILSIGSG